MTASENGCSDEARLDGVGRTPDVPVADAAQPESRIELEPSVADAEEPAAKQAAVPRRRPPPRTLSTESESGSGQAKRRFSLRLGGSWRLGRAGWLRVGLGLLVVVAAVALLWLRHEVDRSPTGDESAIAGEISALRAELSAIRREQTRSSVADMDEPAKAGDFLATLEAVVNTYSRSARVSRIDVSDTGLTVTVNARNADALALYVETLTNAVSAMSDSKIRREIAMEHSPEESGGDRLGLPIRAKITMVPQ